MIEFVEIRDTTRTVIGIIDTAQSVIWHSVYYGVGDFEIYAQATQKHLDLLSVGNYVTRQDNDEVGIIEQIKISYTQQNGLMITASGRFAKSILASRVIYALSGKSVKPAILSGKVEEAVRKVVSDNAIACAFDSNRNISILQLGALANIPDIIVDYEGKAAQKQVSCDNLMTYTDDLLQEYELSARVLLDDNTKMLKYSVYKGTDRSAYIVFSQEFDNLVESEYEFNRADEKNMALIGGEGEGIDRFYSALVGSKTGFQRREIFIDASSMNKKYKDDKDVEHTYTDTEYKSLLDLQGQQELALRTVLEQFNGKIDITNGIWQINRDFYIGDVVTIQDNNIGKYSKVRIVEVLEAQDENGYTVEAVYK